MLRTGPPPLHTEATPARRTATLGGPTVFTAEGVHAALHHIPEGARVVVTLDCDGLDPGSMPGVAARAPGGLTYTQAIDLIAGVGKRATIAGFDLVELYPPADIDNLSALTASRLLVNAIGAIVRQNRSIQT